MSTPLLDGISSPADLRGFSREELETLCDEIRHEILRVTMANGGHLASNLGVVELTVAWHRVFDSPCDRLIFDVGHQCYTHKLLTGRRGEFDTLRQPGGLSGFQKRTESEHDPFGAGHSGTSLSAALGFAESDRLDGSERTTTAVVGDGAFTCGMIHEAMNNCRKDLRLVIILNENEMSISPNIGSFAEYLAKIRASGGYYRAKRRTEGLLRKIPLVGEPMVRGIRAVKRKFKSLLYSSNIFEDLGIYYFGPVNGHDLPRLEAILREAKEYGGCCLIHVKTKKGRGYEPAEREPDRYHGIAPMAAQLPDSFSSRCAELICREAERDPRVVAITAAMAEGTGLSSFRTRFPNRFFDVGIAEGHAATFAAGLAAAGKRPVFAVYSTFLQRSYDNLLHDLALQNLPALICVDRAGLAPADGPTHHGIFDVSFCSQIPGARIFAPLDYEGLSRCFADAAECGALAFLRYPAGQEDAALSRAMPYLKGERFLRGSAGGRADAVLVTYGRITAQALAAREILRGEGISLRVLALERLAPYDRTLAALRPYLGESIPVLFLEEGIAAGGAAMHLRDALLAAESAPRRVKILALRDFVIQTKPEAILATACLTAKDIAAAVRKMVT